MGISLVGVVTVIIGGDTPVVEAGVRERDGEGSRMSLVREDRVKEGRRSIYLQYVVIGLRGGIPGEGDSSWGQDGLMMGIYEGKGLRGGQAVDDGNELVGGVGTAVGGGDDERYVVGAGAGIGMLRMLQGRGVGVSEVPVPVGDGMAGGRRGEIGE